jgi:hypothetical protein
MILTMIGVPYSALMMVLITVLLIAQKDCTIIAKLCQTDGRCTERESPSKER